MKFRANFRKSNLIVNAVILCKRAEDRDKSKNMRKERQSEMEKEEDNETQRQ